MNTRAALRTPDVMRQAHARLRRGELPVDLLDASIGRSWQRCLEHGLMPNARPDMQQLSQDELRGRRHVHRDLIALVEPLATRLVEDMRSCQLLLVAPDATVLKSYGRDFSLHGNLSIVPGMSCEEQWFGTNAPALAAIERQAVLVKSSEHLLFPDNPVSCVAAPLLDMRGQCLGMIDLTFDAAHPRPELFLRRVQQLTGTLEQRLFRSCYQQRWVLQVHASLAELDSVSCGLLAINDEGIVLAADPQASGWLGHRAGALVGLAVEELLGSPWPGIRDQCENQSVLLGLEIAGVSLVGRLNAPDQWQPDAVPPAPVPDERLGQPRRDGGLDSLLAGWPAPLQREARRACRALSAGLPVMLQGDTGTGKERLARLLHAETCPGGPFVAVNCAAIPESLIEAELFGYAEGAFTGARKGGYSGRLMQASGGILLLDEIGDMPTALQSRLLRVLQERVVTPLADHRELPVDLRVIAASHRDLETLVAEGTFREDLFYRLAGAVVELPLLADQVNLGELIQQHWDELCCHHQRHIPLDGALLRQLAVYDWPGNWRELAHCLEMALVGAEPGIAVVTADDLSPRWQRKLARSAGSRRTEARASAGEEAELGLRALEREHMVRTLEAQGGNLTATAKVLGISRSTLYRRLG